MRFGADVNSTAQKSAGGDYHTAGAEASPLESFDSKNTPLTRIENESGNRTLDSLQVSLVLEKRTDRASVQSAVALRAWSPHSRALAAVEHPELNHGKVSSSSHDSAECIDLTDHGSLGNAADRGIAGHLPDRFERARDQPHPSPETASRDRCLGTGVAGADHDDIEFRFKVPRLGHTLKISAARSCPCS